MTENRTFEENSYFTQLTNELIAKHQFHTDKHVELSRAADEVEQSFINDLTAALEEQGAEDLQEIMKEPEIYYFLTPVPAMIYSECPLANPIVHAFKLPTPVPAC
ncbi:hypothetical protein OURE66S_02337 [Oligella ureolytica]